MPTSAPSAAKPSKSIFDPFNSSATGHQRADNRLSGSTSWRDSRSLKLREQFTSGTGGGKRVSDTVGAGSLDFGQDGRTESGGWVKGAKGLRTDGQKSIWETMDGVSVDKAVERPSKGMETDDEEKPTSVVNPWTPFRKQNGTIRETSWTSHESSPSHLLTPLDACDETMASAPYADTVQEPKKGKEDMAYSQVLANVTIYINGSTAPTISDHKLKHLISNHGGKMSIALGRRTVTHVVLGRPNSSGGSGGGLAGSKIHKEVTRMRGNAVKFVTVDWVLESIKAGKRLPESRFEALRLAPKGVGNVSTMFAGKCKPVEDG